MNKTNRKLQKRLLNKIKHVSLACKVNQYVSEKCACVQRMFEENLRIVGFRHVLFTDTANFISTCTT